MTVEIKYTITELLSNKYNPFPLPSSYGQMWDAAQGALEDLLEDEYPTMQLRPQKDRLQVFQTLATFYLRYLKIFRALEEVYDQIVHPQKRRVVHQVLEGVMGRIVELKNEMVELEYSEFHYFDDILQDFKMTPVSEIAKYAVACTESWEHFGLFSWL